MTEVKKYFKENPKSTWENDEDYPIINAKITMHNSRARIAELQAKLDSMHSTTVSEEIH